MRLVARAAVKHALGVQCCRVCEKKPAAAAAEPLLSFGFVAAPRRVYLVYYQRAGAAASAPRCAPSGSHRPHRPLDRTRAAALCASSWIDSETVQRARARSRPRGARTLRPARPSLASHCASIIIIIIVITFTIIIIIITGGEIVVWVHTVYYKGIISGA